MKWKTFGQIVLLLVIAGVIFYIVIPKYTFFRPNYGGYIIKTNKFTGSIEKIDIRNLQFGEGKRTPRLVPDDELPDLKFDEK